MRTKVIVGSFSLLVCFTLCTATAQAQWTPEEQMKVRAGQRSTGVTGREARPLYRERGCDDCG